MKVKKRTVWLFTFVSLVAVIAVFYIFEDNNTPNIWTIFSDEAIEQADILGVTQSGVQPVNSESDLFQDVRLEQANKRSQLREQLTLKIGSDEYSAEEKNTAYDEMENLIKLESSEAMLEMLIESIGYTDALVRIDGEKVMVTVMSDEMSKQQANEILYLVHSELEGYVDVSVDFEPFQ